MIQLYSWRTPNGHKIQIMLEECSHAYTIHPVNIGKGEQFAPEFLKISPNNKIPAMVDEDGPGGRPIGLFESGAILMYLAGKTGMFMPYARADPRRYYAVLQWLMFQMAHIGPMLGQTHHFRMYAPEPVPYAIERYTKEAGRLYRVLAARLSESPWIGGDSYTIADMAIFPWIRSSSNQGQAIEEYPAVKRWFDAIAARPAVIRGLAALPSTPRAGPISAAEREVLFGAIQYARH
ncbi:MAG: glutathione S-transferase family protein [Alphaproteobacteria bacterium]|nr:glutathione S-transferase family protein [Alphaproteobacteria bacterium]